MAKDASDDCGLYRLSDDDFIRNASFINQLGSSMRVVHAVVTREAEVRFLSPQPQPKRGIQWR